MPNWSEANRIIAAAEAEGATIGAAALAPDGSRFSHNGGQRFVAASTIKIAIMVELYRQVDAGRLRLDQTITLGPDNKSAGSGVLIHMHDGLALTLDDVCFLMMSISDNSATNMLIDAVGMDAVNATMRTLGLPNSLLGRPMRGRPALPGETENWVVPDEFADLIAAILAGRTASAAGTAAMITQLERQQNPRRIARHLARAGNPRWGSKTGSLSNVTNDVGFIETKAGPLALSLFCMNAPDAHAGEAILGDIAWALFSAVT